MYRWWLAVLCGSHSNAQPYNPTTPQPHKLIPPQPPLQRARGKLPSHRRGGVREARGGDSSFNTPPPLPGPRPLKGWGAKRRNEKREASLFVIRLGLALGDVRRRFQSEAEKEPLGESPIKRKKHLVMRCFCDPFGARARRRRRRFQSEAEKEPLGESPL